MKWQISEQILNWPKELEKQLQELSPKMALSDIVRLGLSIDEAGRLLHKKTSVQDAQNAIGILQGIERVLVDFEKKVGENR